jgi:hypothetical protein
MLVRSGEEKMVRARKNKECDKEEGMTVFI